MLKMALATAAPTMPSTIFMIVPMLLFMSFSAGQPTIPPMMWATPASHPSDLCQSCRSIGRSFNRSATSGWALAPAHAKSGDPAIISGYCGTGDALPDAIAKFSLAYLEHHAALQTAARAGRITVAEQAWRDQSEVQEQGSGGPVWS